jgi:FMN phosphatase YigB (HAD superfamily)
MKPPEVVVFDLGKVLLDFDYGIAARQLGLRCPDGNCDLRELIDQSPLLHRYETGLIDTAAFFQEVRTFSGYAGDPAEFAACFGDIFSEIPPMVEIHASLRALGIPSFIFSNTNEIAIGHIRRNFPFFARFDGYIFSYEHGAMKPEESIYRAVERETKRSHDAILYIDDREENIEVGKRLGWRTIWHQNPRKTRSEFGHFGLPIDVP